RFCLLMSSEHLYSVAAGSQGRLKQERTRRASELLEMAIGIDKQKSAGSRNWSTAKSRGKDREQEGDEDSVSGDRFQVEKRPDVTFASIAGLEDVKEEIRLKIIYPFKHPERAERYGIRAGGGVLLYGPPGTGKTLLARAVAGEVESAFYTVKPSEILSKWVGEAEKNLAALFDSARSNAPSIIFIDEIDALAPRRSENRSTVMARLVPQILAELEGFSGREESLLFLGATNVPWSLDPAILRPGRFDERIYVGLPDQAANERILEIYLEDRPLGDDVDLYHLSQVLEREGYSGADIRNICRKAADEAFLKSIRSDTDHVIDQATLLSIIREVKPSVHPDMLKRYNEYHKRGK
ncbi:MAG: ATP-binding protein, partial [Planctomycetota bacterium]